MQSFRITHQITRLFPFTTYIPSLGASTAYEESSEDGSGGGVDAVTLSGINREGRAVLVQIKKASQVLH